MTPYLVALACRGIGVREANKVLRAGPVSEPARQMLDEELARCDEVEGYRRALVSERAFGLDSFRTMPLADFWIGRAFWNRQRCHYLDLMDRYLVEVDKPFPMLSVHDDSAAAIGPLPSLVAPALQLTRIAMDRTRAQTRSLRVLNALQRRAEPEKMPAADLSDLGLPRESVTDPFTGKPLVVKKLPGGWLIYSVGPNLEDNGGKIDEDDPEQQDFGVGPLAPPTESGDGE